MSSSGATYQLRTFNRLIGYGWPKVSFLKDRTDYEQEDARLEINAQVRSGDYFVTLATTLDSLSKDINSYQTRAELEDLVSDLIYLQDNYIITKNKGLE